MPTPKKKTMILAGAFSAGLIAVGGTLAVADGMGDDSSTTQRPVAVADTSTTTSGTTTSVAPPPAGQPSTAVSREQARQIALGVAPGARVVDIELDRADVDDDDSSDRVTRWEVDLVRGNIEYDVDIDAQTGQILKNRSDVDDDAYDDNGSDDNGRDDDSSYDDRGRDDDGSYDDHGRHGGDDSHDDGSHHGADDDSGGDDS